MNYFMIDVDVKTTGDEEYVRGMQAAIREAIEHYMADEETPDVSRVEVGCRMYQQLTT